MRKRVKKHSYLGEKLHKFFTPHCSLGSSIFPATVALLFILLTPSAHAAPKISYFSKCQDLNGTANELLTSAPIVTDEKKEEFFRLVKKETEEYLYISGYHAELLANCIKMLNYNNTTWFQTIIDDPEKFRPYCEYQINEIRKNIKSTWPVMRKSIALATPRIREDRLLNIMQAKVNPNPQHSFTEPMGLNSIAKIPALSPEELKRALAEYEQFVLDAKNDFFELHPEYINKTWMEYAEIEADKFAVRRLREFRTLQREAYWETLQAVPTLVYLTTGNPSNLELIQAFTKIQDNAQTALKKLQIDGEKNHDLYAGFTAIISGFTDNKPEYCDAAMAWMNHIKQKEAISLGIRMSITIGTGLTTYFAKSMILKVASEVLSTVVSGSYIIGTQKDYNITYTQALASVMNQQGIADFAKLESDQRKLLFTLAFLPSNLTLGLSNTSGELKSAGTRYLRNRNFFRH